MSYQVRLLRTDDLPSVTEIYNAACRARESTQGIRHWSIYEMKHFLFEAQRSFPSYTCVDNGHVVGWTAFTRYRVRESIGDTAEMSLYVERSFRHKGIGSLLANTILNRASAIDLHCIFALTFKDTPDVISFAERKCRFSVVGSLPEVFSDGEHCYDIVVLERPARG
ncbi:GNAT family N-acetyltransferase [Bradyrhizobium sp. 177]|uniref:GNAT family N-acetyltransferase n=1 Tax=Bradyrhizobium sp. 177 TaxID=2782647 RepID=UPI001FF76FCF|nr:GNAT family N-acetyltransferase [Bradyrhizobium sp. 177]MCK1554481.1 GNAT family N-acetyltransferase [Bradyrhizobium sp. 177]